MNSIKGCSLHNSSTQIYSSSQPWRLTNFPFIVCCHYSQPNSLMLIGCTFAHAILHHNRKSRNMAMYKNTYWARSHCGLCELDEDCASPDAWWSTRRADEYTVATACKPLPRPDKTNPLHKKFNPRSRVRSTYACEQIPTNEFFLRCLNPYEHRCFSLKHVTMTPWTNTNCWYSCSLSEAMFTVGML